MILDLIVPVPDQYLLLLLIYSLTLIIELHLATGFCFETFNVLVIPIEYLSDISIKSNTIGKGLRVTRVSGEC